MKVLGTNVLIIPEKTETTLVNKPINKGEVLSFGEEVKNLTSGDRVIFDSSEADKIVVDLPSGTAELMIIDKKAIRIAFDVSEKGKA